MRPKVITTKDYFKLLVKFKLCKKSKLTAAFFFKCYCKLISRLGLRKLI